MTRKYWKGLEELHETPEFLQQKDQEFPQSMSVDEFLGDENLKESSTARRDFLKFLGFSVAAATVAACEAPVTKAIPYVIKPENVTPGMPTWYASTYYDGMSYASILVKTREGRPIFIKGNKDKGFGMGATNPQIIASVLSLYDSNRLTGPTISGKAASWVDLDKGVGSALGNIIKNKGKVVLVSNTIVSPSTMTAIELLKMKVNGGDAAGTSFEHIQYDGISYAGIRQAYKDSFGLTTVKEDPKSDGIIPDFDFSKAKTIVSVGADFLSTWLVSTDYQSQYAMRRNPDGEWMSKHFQFESNLSITGSNADYRGMIKPSEQAHVLSYLLGKFGVKTGVNASFADKNVAKIADMAFDALKKSKGESLVVASSNNAAVQTLVAKLNSVLGAYAHTINVNNPVMMFASQDAKMNKFAADVISGKGPKAVIFYGVNPAYTLSNGAAFAKALSGIELTVSFGGFADETASMCKYVAPDHHALESWNDYNPKMNHYGLAQPTIRPLNNTAAAQESMMVWADSKYTRGGKDSKVYYELIKSNWITYGFPQQTEYTDANIYWNMMVHDSCSSMPVTPASAPTFNDAALSGVSSNIKSGSGVEVEFYQKAGIGIGIQANNPWLQELPDPISKVTWDNYITMNPSQMGTEYATYFDQESGLNMASIKVGSNEITLPVYPSPGQALDTVGVALGYGRGENNENIGNAAYQTKEYGGYVEGENGKRVPIGKNAFRLVQMENGTMSNSANATVSKVEGMYPIAATQIHHTVMGRHSIVRETTLDIYNKEDKEAYNPAYTLKKLDAEGNHVDAPMKEFDLWDAHPVEHIGHRWGMTIDLSSCIGCGSCLVACQSENNVPVVGKDEVRRGREMHWLRIDRYYASDEEATVGQRKDPKTFSFDKAEIAAENPKVIHMPMLCHHCNHAPCETVCPVAATTHSNEGLNQMAYNRCIGTRYCANNCPYKVRRFNWFNYPSYKKFTQVNPAQDDLGRMVLNPDVTVRTRGVMEKCSFCVQKIQAGKLVAKKEARPVMDGDVSTACAEVCPSNAITVGDWNDIKSMVRKSSEDKRAYQALEEVGVKPNIWYKVKVRNEKNNLLAGIQKIEDHAEHAAHGSEKENKKAHH